MPTLKQQGNEAFKQKKYKEALKYYEQYVQQEHPDNKNAYFNLGLCYSKLGQHIKSIEACKNATVLDPAYDKAYYRLMKEYCEINNHYQVFINAQQYIKQSHNSDHELLTEAKEYLQNSKSKLRLPPQSKKLQENNEIFALIEPLKPILENNPQFNEQVDKYPKEWIEQWQTGIQSQDAKWQQIAYIVRQLNPQYGASLAYYYYNQNKRSPQAKAIYQQIKELKEEANLTEKIDYQDNNYLLRNNHPQQQQREEINIIKDQTATSSPKKAQNTQVPSADKKIEAPQNKKANKIQDLLQSKANIKKQYEETKTPQIQQTIKSQVAPTPSPAIIQQKKPQPKPKQTVKTNEQKLEQLYQHYCGKIQKSKDIFNQVYRSIYQILQGKEQQMKGRLLMLLKKRVKKLKVIIASLSDNEQRVVFDLLKKCKMQEYAVDFAPAYFKL